MNDICPEVHKSIPGSRDHSGKFFKALFENLSTTAKLEMSNPNHEAYNQEGCRRDVSPWPMDNTEPRSNQVFHRSILVILNKLKIISILKVAWQKKIEVFFQSLVNNKNNFQQNLNHFFNEFFLLYPINLIRHKNKEVRT